MYLMQKGYTETFLSMVSTPRGPPCLFSDGYLPAFAWQSDLCQSIIFLSFFPCSLMLLSMRGEEANAAPVLSRGSITTCRAHSMLAASHIAICLYVERVELAFFPQETGRDDHFYNLYISLLIYKGHVTPCDSKSWTTHAKTSGKLVHAYGPQIFRPECSSCPITVRRWCQCFDITFSILIMVNCVTKPGHAETVAER